MNVQIGGAGIVWASGFVEPEDVPAKNKPYVEAEAAKEAADLEVEQTEPVDTVAIKETT